MRANHLCPKCKKNIKTSSVPKKIGPGVFFRCPGCKTLLVYFDTGRGMDVWEVDMYGLGQTVQ